MFTYKTVIDPKVPTPYSSNYGPVEKVEVLDKYTIKLHTKNYMLLHSSREGWA
ncbi:MAG: hypothetical protein ACOYU0_06205 [Nitrospirota bacterium]